MYFNFNVQKSFLYIKNNIVHLLDTIHWSCIKQMNQIISLITIMRLSYRENNIYTISMLCSRHRHYQTQLTSTLQIMNSTTTTEKVVELYQRFWFYDTTHAHRFN